MGTLPYFQPGKAPIGFKNHNATDFTDFHKLNP
jgi:hypothetical protein